MKALRKNVYAVAVILLFAIATAMLALFLALYSSSTSVDGTVVGSVYIGDEKPNSSARQKKLEDGVKKWKKDAMYTISFQDVNLVIGRTPVLDENNEQAYDKDENGEYILDDEGNKIPSYDYNGLTILDFDYKTTNANIINGSSDNLASFTISNESRIEFKKLLVEYFGSEITSDQYFLYQKLEDAIIENANSMTSKCDFDLYDYVTPGWNDTYVGEQVQIEHLDEGDVKKLVDIFKNEKIEIYPQSDPSGKGKLGFSAVEYFSQPQFQTLSSAYMSIIATGLAAVVQKTSLYVTVKNQGYMNDQYYAYNGMTARVNVKDGTDLRIMNPETNSYVVSVTRGVDGNDGTASLQFKIEGCKFINKYEVKKQTTEIKYEIVYNDSSFDFDYDPTNPLMGIDTEYEGGCYYLIYRPGEYTYLYSYDKIITYVDGSTNAIYAEDGKTVLDYPDVYPKQEFIVGKDELRYWKKITPSA